LGQGGDACACREDACGDHRETWHAAQVEWQRQGAWNADGQGDEEACGESEGDGEESGEEVDHSSEGIYTTEAQSHREKLCVLCVSVVFIFMGDKFAAIVLAAGESRRMGEPKQLLLWGDHTIIEQIVGTLMQAPLDEVVVVVGHRADEVRAKVQSSRFNFQPPTSNLQLPTSNFQPPMMRCELNPNYREGGMLSSIQFGVSQLREDVRAAFIVLCDQPQVKATTLAKLRGAFEQSDRGMVVPSYQMKRGHPLLIDVRKYRAEILAIEGAPGMQKLLRDHPDDILHVVFDDPSVLVDMDTREDYERAVKLSTDSTTDKRIKTD
jgi:molybdenum cofactor cytidylyltransferase